VHYFLQKALSHVNLPATSTQNAILNQNVHKMHFSSLVERIKLP